MGWEGAPSSEPKSEETDASVRIAARRTSLFKPPRVDHEDNGMGGWGGQAQNVQSLHPEVDVMDLEMSFTLMRADGDRGLDRSTMLNYLNTDDNVRRCLKMPAVGEEL